MLTHTSGLRDWGAVVAAAGWPRGSRVHTHGHVLEVLSRQRSLNFPSGTEYSYSNSGYNLAAILVTRVAGMPFAELTRDRIFVPLGMTRTQWRDDYTRIVRGRASAYSKMGSEWHSSMPFENVHGNGGLLTTVGDLLRWNAALDAGTLAGADFAAEEQRPGALADGKPIRYAMGLMVDTWRGTREVSHNGATSGYRAGLARYPDLGLSVAVLCNTADASGSVLLRQVAEAFLGDRLPAEPVATPPAGPAAAVPESVLKTRVGVYRDTKTMDITRIDVVDGVLKVDGRDALIPVDDRTFLYQPSPANRVVFQVDAAGRAFGLHWIDSDGTAEYVRAETVAMDAAGRAAYAGRYFAEEADATIALTVDGDDLVASNGPDFSAKLVPVDRDIFSLPSVGAFAFDRDRKGKVRGFRFFSGRLRGLRFDRQEARR
jgi:hypothetical protein